MKKGVVAITYVIGLIIIVVSMLAIIAFLLNLFGRASQGYDNTVCRASVLANSKLNNPILGQNAWPIECPTVYYYFDSQGFMMEAGEWKEKYVYSLKSRDLRPEIKEYVTCMNDNSVKESFGMDKETICKIRNVNSLIAQAHARCWEQFGYGELPLFDRLDSERQCVVCSVYDFSDDFQDEVDGYYIDDVVAEKHTLDYMMRTTGPLGRDITYAELTLDGLDVFDPPYYTYNLEESYASIFIANNEDYLNTKVGQIADLAGKLINLDLGEEGEAYFLNTNEFIPESMVARECDVLVEQ